MTNSGSVLFIHSRDISTPLGTTVPHYLTKKLSDRRDVHVICPKQRAEYDEAYEREVTRVYHLPTGSVPIVSALLYTSLSLLVALGVGIWYRYDAVYAYKETLIQGYVAAVCGSSRFVVGLQVVPIRQWSEFDDYRSHGTVRDAVEAFFMETYATFVADILLRADQIICLTDGIRDLTEEEYGIDSSCTHVVGMGIDTDTFDTDPNSGPDADDRWVITYVGTINNTRNIGDVVEAISRTDHTFEFRLVGNVYSEEYREQLNETAADRGVQENVQWYGVVPHEEIPELLAETDIAVSPLPDIESYRVSFPAKLLEYLASGTIVVCSDIAPHERLIEDGNGYLYDGTVEGLAAALDDVVDDRDRHDVLTGRARETAVAYDWENIVSQHEAIVFDT